MEESESGEERGECGVECECRREGLKWKRAKAGEGAWRLVRGQAERHGIQVKEIGRRGGKKKE